MRRELGFWLTWWVGFALFLVTTFMLSTAGLPLLAAAGLGLVVALGYAMWTRRAFFR